MREVAAPGEALSVEEWNARAPIGTRVHYFPVAGSHSFVTTRTRSEAWALGHGAVAVLVEGVRGGVSVKHLVILEEE